jgi:hypothetical protein
MTSLILLSIIPSLETENTAIGICHTDDVAPSICMLALTSLTIGGHSVGIVHLRTQATEFFLVLFYYYSPQSTLHSIGTESVA